MKELDLVISGYAGARGASRIARNYQKELCSRFRPEYVHRILRAEEQRLCGHPESRERAEESGALEVFKAERGGILAAVYAAAQQKKCGLRLFLPKVPVRQETIEICEWFRLNPYRLYSDCLLSLSESGIRLEQRLCEQGIPSACVGFLTESPDKVVIGKKEPEYLNPPEADELLKLFPGAFF
ncbi:hypothetical protein B6K86_04455 [Lachnospiraceae bacterium]|nr:hypothetical protein B6K86_04455 [Lachnospiraceae bacterium]